MQTRSASRSANGHSIGLTKQRKRRAAVSSGSKSKSRRQESEPRKPLSPVTPDVSRPAGRLQAESNCCGYSPTDDEAEHSFLEALKGLRKFDTGHVVCRENEAASIYNFIEKCITNRESASMYIAGYPGTGKTYVVRHIFKRTKKKFPNTDTLMVNCMNASTPVNLYRDVCRHLGITGDGSFKEVAVSLERGLKKRKRMLLICLDEVDLLCRTDSSVLYRTFRWPEVSEKVILIGIANAFDMIERELPKLKLEQCKLPEIVHFKPYTKDQVECILKHRLQPVLDTVDQKALEFCARKVSAVTGDIRAALDICKISLHNSPMQSLHEGARSGGRPSVDGDRLIMSSVEMARSVNEVLNKRFEPVAATLPLQQKLLLALALRMQRQGRKMFSTFVIYKEYSEHCKKTNVPKMSSSEVQNACQLLESNNLLTICKKTGEYKLGVEENSVRRFIQDEKTIMNILK
uniref:Cell division control protein n=1 Tax=Trichuris muris TaxID=70415 RepID=A0A5S6Q021_TRIMR